MAVSAATPNLAGLPTAEPVEAVARPTAAKLAAVGTRLERPHMTQFRLARHPPPLTSTGAPVAMQPVVPRQLAMHLVAARLAEPVAVGALRAERPPVVTSVAAAISEVRAVLARAAREPVAPAQAGKAARLPQVMRPVAPEVLVDLVATVATRFLAKPLPATEAMPRPMRR